MLKQLIVISTLLTSSLVCAEAHWELYKPRAVINFISIKNNSVGEVHDFNNLSGQISSKGELEIQIPYTNLSTGIPIRDERLNKFLFNFKDAPAATIKATVLPSKIKELKLGYPQFLELPVTLTIGQHSKEYKAQVVLTRVLENRILVTNIRPLIVNAKDFQLESGIEELKKIAKLDAIATAVPVSFALTFAEK